MKRVTVEEGNPSSVFCSDAAAIFTSQRILCSWRQEYLSDATISDRAAVRKVAKCLHFQTFGRDIERPTPNTDQMKLSKSGTKSGWVWL